MKKIITLTTEGGDCEDGNVYYSESVLVDNRNNPALNFSEPIFTSSALSGDSVDGGYGDAMAAICLLGYAIERFEQIIVVCDSIEGDDDEEWGEE